MSFFGRLSLILLSLCLLLCCCAPSVAEDDEGVTLTCLNVAKADCLLLTAYGKNYLIDTGTASTYPALATMLAHYGVKKLDGVFLTHCHVDHYGGLSRLAASDVEVGAWYASEVYFDVSRGAHPLALAAKKRGMEATWLRVGDVIDVNADARFTVLGPVVMDDENENNNSLVMRFDSPDGSMLLTGDMKTEEEATLLYRKLIAPVDVLKVGHHGDSGATSRSLLDAAQPKIAVISTNSIEETDTPSPATLKRLREAGAETFFTQDAECAVVVTLRGGKATASYAAWEELPALPRIALSLDVANDLITVQNLTDDAQTIENCTLYSVRGGETHVVPALSLPARGTFLIGTKTTKVSCDYVLPEKRVWHKSKRDVAILSDSYGRILAITENGMSE